ncbi:hypothetical protein EG329_011748 [Mollisiaceae sp. DMI_Dod_QoI]|nr:hypothetical protein EG329_011748 [Helotiales sp. DMI_Dod_QoI]
MTSRIAMGRPADVEKTVSSPAAPAYTSQQAQTNIHPFIGRLGGNQGFVLDRNEPCNAAVLSDIPDAAPYMTYREQLDLKPFRSLSLWKSALAEGMVDGAFYQTGSMMLIYLTGWIGLSPSSIPLPPDPQFGPFDNAAFIGPIVGGITNWFILTLFTFSFGAVSGAHFNPMITIATFCVRLSSLPRTILYIAFQTAGGALAGLLIRASYGTRDFKIGGCWLYSDVVPVSNAFVVEFMCSLILIFLAFGVGLDPRQKQTIGPSLGPFLVGMVLAVVSFGSAFTRYGFGGAGMNPARCFGAFVGSRFPGWHWIHW